MVKARNRARKRENFVHGAEAERIRSYIRENRGHTIIANLEVRLVETQDKYWGTIGAINENFVNVPEELVKRYPMLLAGGMWGTIELTYDETEVHNKKIRPFKVVDFTPFQISMIDVSEFVEKRREFSGDEWIDILINSFGLDPASMTRREKLLYISRAVPLVETNHNMIELGPRETGKAYLYRNISYYAHVLSGGKATPASLFINLNTGKVGLVGTREYGFITDYLCEIMHELRRVDGTAQAKAKNRFELFDASGSSQGTTSRDMRGVHKTLSGLLKLLYPHGEVSDEQLEELLLLALEGRQRIRNQLHLMAPGEYYPVQLSARMIPSGKIIAPTLLEAGRKQRIELPTQPLVGEVIGLAVAGEQGVIQRFEMQVTKGHGRIVPLGSIQRVMRESIEAAAQYIRAHYKELDIAADWHENFDVAVLATMMGIPKEGPSAGITIVTGIVSALRNVPVRHDIAMTGEITIMGKVLGVGGVQAKLLAATEAGVKTVILPSENEQDVRFLPDYMRDKVEIHYVSDIKEVLELALVPEQ